MTTAWITAFVDVPASRQAAAAAFWCGVTGSTLSSTRGADGEFATFLPPDGDPYLRFQRIGAGPAGVHLDLHEGDRDLEVLRSPGGLPYCLNEGESGVRPLPRIWAGGQASLVDQVCLDVPPSAYDAECAFWADATGWELHEGSRPEFRFLARPDEVPLRILLQRLDEENGPVRAHLDLATTDRAAETDRHRGLGARVEATRQHWTVLRDPSGATYCITDRDPYTGVL
ncbi:VOC family protein [Nocardioides marmoriginsengisoli]|uniref:VOC family protein n=1 Tax=Nocardioides marmoriginsengisoli TaxID=661483 RepID=UPI001C82826D|nr:VOC family protein [Nocardioides marmoriginsengisoli]